MCEWNTEYNRMDKDEAEASGNESWSIFPFKATNNDDDDDYDLCLWHRSMDATCALQLN